MDYNILNCSGDELALLIILIAMKISKRVDIDDLNALAGIFSALAGLMFLEAKQQQRFQQAQENEKKECEKYCNVDNNNSSNTSTSNDDIIYYYCKNVKNTRKYRKKNNNK